MAALRELSGRALRARLRNLVYVRAAVEDLPPELTGAADALTVILPWGSLLATVARPRPDALRGIRRLCQPGALLTVVLAPHAARDRAELERLGLPALGAPHLAGLSDAYGAARFDRVRVRMLDASALARWPSTWARRLAHAPGRTVFEVQARAAR